MKNRFYKILFLTFLLVLCIFPKTAGAAEEEPEYDFNKNKKINLTGEESYTVSKKNIWLKYTPSADGYLTVKTLASELTGQNAKGYIALFNSTKGTFLSSKSIFFNTEYAKNAYWNTFVFGMKKGQVYYIRIRPDKAVTLSRTFTKTKDKSGDLRSTAQNVKKNKVKTGLIPAGVSDVDWYKIKLTKKQRIRLYYTVKTNGRFKLSVYSSTHQIGNMTLENTSGQVKVALYELDSAKKKKSLPAGVYYIAVQRSDSVSSGYYKLKWN